MPNLLADYSAGGPGHDEMLQAQGPAKDAWEHLAGAAGLKSWLHLSARRDRVVSLLADQGLRSGADQASAWLLDPLPVILDDAEWRRLEVGLAQRAQVLDAILADLYSDRRLLLDGVLPPEIVLGHPGFVRAADQIRLPTNQQLFHTSAHLARDADGSWSVLADTTDTPSGLGYAMADRRAISEVLTNAYRAIPVHPLGPFFDTFRRRLAESTPTGIDAPQVVMVVAGNKPTTFDQAYLADTLGITLATPSDLIVADGRLWLRTLGDVEPVDVLLRQLASAETDPVDLTSTASGGVAGLIEAAHSGSVSVINPVGVGVLENPALRTYLPRICRHLFKTDLILPSAVTYWCGERSMGSHVIAHLDRLMITSTASGATVNGWDLSIGERADLAARISATPHLWVGQEPLEISTTPTVGVEELTPRPTSIHSFAVSEGDSYTIMPGGLGMTCSPSGYRESTDAAKDVWILTDSASTPPAEIEPARATGAIIMSTGVASNLFQFGVYLERAEAVIRLARDRISVEAPTTTGSSALSPATPSNLIASEPPSDIATVSPITMDRVSEALSTLGHHARRIRDHLTPEAWRALASLEQPAPLAQHLVNLAALSGVVSNSIIQNHGWHLLTLGRQIEQARFILNSFRELEAVSGSSPLSSQIGPINQILRRHDSLLTFRRRNQVTPTVQALIYLLLLDATNPRSLAFCLTNIADTLDKLPTEVTARAQLNQPVEDLQNLLSKADLSVLSRPDGTAVSDFVASLSWRFESLYESVQQDQLSKLTTELWTAEPHDPNSGESSNFSEGGNVA